MNQHNNNFFVRPHVGYVLKRYPRFSETFVVNEILAHERAGLKIDIFALGAVMETHFQDVISQVKGSVTRYSEKLRSSDAFWKIFLEGRRVLPDFDRKIAALGHKNVHEIAQGILLAIDVRERGITHLHAHFATRATTVARLGAMFSDVTYSFTAHAKDIYFPYEESTQIEHKLRDAIKTITVSDYNLAYLKEQYGHDADKTIRIYNGMDLERFPYGRKSNGSRHILSVGRLVAKKGFDVLIEAMAILKQRQVDVKCSLVGDGVLYDQLSAHIQRLDVGDVVTLTGQKPQPEIIDMMQNSAMMVAPCTVSEEGDRDGLPTVLVESMALGTPVISTQVAGIPELVQHEKTGLCVAPNDPVVFADAMELLLSDEALQEKLSKGARQLIENEYDINLNTAQLRDIFSHSNVNVQNKGEVQ